MATHQFVSALAGLSYALLADHLPRELLAFAKHAGRRVVQDEDLLLFARKTSLQAHLREYRELMADVPKRPAARRGGRRARDPAADEGSEDD
jgi:hypothetical protein